LGIFAQDFDRRSGTLRRLHQPVMIAHRLRLMPTFIVFVLIEEFLRQAFFAKILKTIKITISSLSASLAPGTL
tara:strand:- start:59 stop:277 length:219 start_codon:yes stop_codon:yes gene_type:complete